MTNQPKPWKNFENLVAAIQAVLSDRGIVTANAQRYDHEAKCKRQIDIVVEDSDGDRQFLTMIEVKDHAQRVGARVVEEVAGVRDGIRADVAVLVARHGFTDAARAKAEAKNVRLRSFRDLTAEDWLSAFVPRFLHVEQLQCEPRELFLFGDSMHPLMPSGGPIADDACFLDASGNDLPLKFLDIVGQMRHAVRPEHLENFDRHGPPQLNFALTQINVRDGTLFLRDADEELREVRFAALAGMWHLERERAAIRVNKYSGTDSPRGATVMESEFVIGGISYELQAVLPDPKDAAEQWLPISLRLTPRTPGKDE